MTLTEIAIHGSLYILNYELFGAPTSIVSRLFTFYSALPLMHDGPPARFL